MFNRIPKDINVNVTVKLDLSSVPPIIDKIANLFGGLTRDEWEKVKERIRKNIQLLNSKK